MALKITVDRDRCGATGNCVYWAPHTFELGDDGISRVIDPQGDELRLVRLAAENCPLKVITVTEE
jgi:ferredoxin